MKNAKLWVFIGVVVVLLVLNGVFGWSDALFGGNVVEALRDAARERPVWAAAVYVFLSLVGCVVLALPGVAFAVVAGTVFGPLWGTLLCWVAVSAGACISFAVGRYFLKRAPSSPNLSKSAALNRLLFEGAQRSDVYLLAITRLVPVFPYNLQNFAYGVTDIRFVPYAVYSALFMLPGTAVYTLAAAGLVDADNRLGVLCRGGGPARGHAGRSRRAQAEGGPVVNAAKLVSVAEKSHYPFKAYPPRALSRAAVLRLRAAVAVPAHGTRRPRRGVPGARHGGGL